MINVSPKKGVKRRVFWQILFLDDFPYQKRNHNRNSQPYTL